MKSNLNVFVSSGQAAKRPLAKSVDNTRTVPQITSIKLNGYLEKMISGTRENISRKSNASI